MEEAFSLIENLRDIPADVVYTGYLWYDNEASPKTICGTVDFPSIEKNTLPFVIEGNLIGTDKAGNEHSISIRFVDGGYRIGRVDWGKVNGNSDIELVDRVYLGKAFPKQVTKLRFKEAWIPQPDPLCEGMEVLQPAWIAFVGFDGEDTKND